MDGSAHSGQPIQRQPPHRTKSWRRSSRRSTDVSHHECPPRPPRPHRYKAARKGRCCDGGGPAAAGPHVPPTAPWPPHPCSGAGIGKDGKSGTAPCIVRPSQNRVATRAGIPPWGVSAITAAGGRRRGDGRRPPKQPTGRLSRSRLGQDQCSRCSPVAPVPPPSLLLLFFFFFLFPWRAALFFFFFCSSFFFPLLIPTLAPMRARARARLMRASIIGLRSQQRQARHHRVTPQAGSTREQRTAGKKGVRPGGRASMGDHPERAAASTGPTAGARHTHHGSRRGSRHPGSRRHGSRHGRDRGHGHACTWLPRPCLARSSALGPP